VSGVPVPAAAVTDARPPLALVRVLSPVLRAVLATPLGRLLPGIAVVRFDGRRSGRPYRVVVGWYDRAAQPTVVTPAPWRVNFAPPDGRVAEVRQGGRTHEMRGTLCVEPAAVAERLNAILDGGSSPGRLGLRARRDHRFTPADVVAVHRAVITFS
jgi:hypothetical protein